MNAALSNLSGKIKFLADNLESIIMEIAQEEAEFIKQMNREQLFDGVDHEGQKLSPPYQPSTVKRKRRKGQPFDRVTTRDKGDHYESIEVEFFDSYFQLSSDDFKSPFLLKKYGKLYGLTQENVERLSGVLKSRLNERIKEIILS